MNRDNTVKFKNMILQIDRQKFKASLANCRVTVFEHSDDTITIGFGEHEVGRFNERGEPINRNYGNAASMENGKKRRFPHPPGKSQTSNPKLPDSDFPTFPQFLLLDNKFMKNTKTGHLMCY